jgi:MFS family permease
LSIIRRKTENPKGRRQDHKSDAGRHNPARSFQETTSSNRITLRESRWVVVVFSSGLFLMSMLYRVSNAVIAPELSRDLGLTPQELGLMGAAFFYAFALAQVPLGPALDRLGVKRTIIFLNLIGAAGATAFALSDGLGSGLAGRALLGLGMSANLMGPFMLYARWFKPVEFATMSGVTMSAGYMGNLLATSPLVVLSQALTWRGAFIALALLNLVLTLGMAIWVGESPPGKSRPIVKPDRKHSGAVHTLVTSRSFWSIALTGGLRYGAFGSIQALWAGPFLMIHLGFDAITAGNLLLFMSVGFASGAPVGGVLSDRVLRSRKQVVLLGISVMAAAILIMAHWPGPVRLKLLGVTMFAFGFFGSFGQVLYSHIKDLMPEDISGSALTGVNFFVFLGAGGFIHGLGGILGRGGSGNLTTGGDYYSAFMICFGTLVLAGVIYAFSRDARLSKKSSSS